MLTDEQIEKHQTIYKKHFGKEVSKAEALERGAKLIKRIKAVYKPMIKEELGKLQKHRKDIDG